MSVSMSILPNFTPIRLETMEPYVTPRTRRRITTTTAAAAAGQLLLLSADFNNNCTLPANSEPMTIIGASMSIGQNSSPMMTEIRSRTGQPLLSDTVRSRRLSFFGHLHRTDPSQDHYRALQACILGPPDDWRRRIGRPRQSWLRTVEADLRPMNLGLATSKRRAQDRYRHGGNS